MDQSIFPAVHWMGPLIFYTL